MEKAKVTIRDRETEIWVISAPTQASANAYILRLFTPFQYGRRCLLQAFDRTALRTLLNPQVCFPAGAFTLAGQL